MVSSAGDLRRQRDEDHKDVLITKLIDGKVTFVHKTMWQQVYAMTPRATTGKWQISLRRSRLLLKLEKEKSLDTSKQWLMGHETGRRRAGFGIKDLDSRRAASY